ncbi:hypothetical protein [Nocardia altamirensis]|uniref:hypothetical protein n=1 Tax=Nocardia altamirensis TaxID=472158 RepID=UPI000840722E|nr:hypothetical protein [Nocardia altamirensis]
MSIPRPSGPYADEILGSHWPSGDPDLLAQIAVDTTSSGNEIRAAAAQMSGIGAGIINHNQGAGPEAMSTQVQLDARTWAEHGETLVRAGTVVDVMAWTIRSVQTQLAALVAEAQAAIATIKTQAAAAEMTATAPGAALAIHAKAEAMIDAIVAAAATEVGTVSAAATVKVSGMAGEITAAAAPSLIPGGAGPLTPGALPPQASTHAAWNPSVPAGPVDTATSTAGSSSSQADGLFGGGRTRLPDTEPAPQGPHQTGLTDPVNPTAPQAGSPNSVSPDPAGAHPAGPAGTPTTPTSTSVGTSGLGTSTTQTGPGTGHGSTGTSARPDVTAGASTGRDLGTSPKGSGVGTTEGTGKGLPGVTVPERSGLGNQGIRLGSNTFGQSPLMNPGTSALTQPAPITPAAPTAESAQAAPRAPVAPTPHSTAVSAAPPIHGGEVRAPAADPAAMMARQPITPSAPGFTGPPPPMSTVGATAMPVHAEGPVVPPAAAAAAATAPVAIRDGAAAAFVAASPSAGLISAPVNVALLHAKTLLSGILAVPGALVTEWAVGVLRAGVIGAPSYVVTSTRGRGWLPRGLHLPVEIALPWVGQTELDSQQWQGLADPTRIIAEYATLMSERFGTELAAVAASVPSALKNALPDEAAFAHSSLADPDIDLAGPTPATMHRLQATWPHMVEQIESVDQARVFDECLGLAWSAADTTPCWDVASPAGYTCVQLRGLILQALHHHTPVDPQWWVELAEADVLLDEAARACRRSPGPSVPYGALPTEDPQFAMISAECAANETVLLLREDPALADVYYAYRQLRSLLRLDDAQTPVRVGDQV